MRDVFARAVQARQKGQGVVVVQGLGFVGSAVAAVIADARDEQGHPRYFVIGVDLASPASFWKVAKLRDGLVPFPSPDAEFDRLIRRGVVDMRNLCAATDETAYGLADVIVVDVGLDVENRHVDQPADIRIGLPAFESALRAVGRNMQPHALVMVETTVPIGACEHVAAPLLREERARRGITDSLKLAHAYERVMPGPQYMASIRRFWRSYSGLDDASAEAAGAFLGSFVDTATFPLRRLATTTATEMAKLLENSYRAVNIAFIHEWTRLAEQVGVNLFDVIDSIRVRQGTHDNIRLPGFGVGGYCLTKDALLAQWGGLHLLGSDVTLEMTLQALRVNYFMPRHTLGLLTEVLDDSLRGKRVTVLGVSYLPEVGDTRSTPTEMLVADLEQAGALVRLHDPYVSRWAERSHASVARDLSAAMADAQALVLAVPHKPYRELDAARLRRLAPQLAAIVDAQNMMNDQTAASLRAAGMRLAGVGKGHWRRLGYQERAGS